jgi:hypothetical protein
MNIVHIHEIFHIIDEHFWNTHNTFSNEYLSNHLVFSNTFLLFYFETLIETLSLMHLVVY